MTCSEAKEIVRGHSPDRSRDEIREAWQFLVNDGIVWDMGKWYVEMASCLIASGVVERNAG